MTVRARLLAGFAAVGVVTLLPSLFAVSQLAQLRHLAVEGRSGQAAAVTGLGEMQALLADLDRLERSLVVTSDSALDRVAREVVDSLVSTHERLLASPYTERARTLTLAVSRIDTLSTEVAAHVATGRTPEATAGVEAMFEAFSALDRRLSAAGASIDAEAQTDFLRAERMSGSARARTLALLLVAILLGGGVVLATTRALTEPLSKLRRAMAHVADGQLEAPRDLPYERSDELGELSRSFERMTDRLAELDRTKAEFMGMASHELKTPLNVIAAYAELIEDELGEEVSEQHRRMICGVSRQAEIMSKRVSRLMDISRLEAGAYRLAPETVRVEDLLTGVLRLFERQAEDRDIALHFGCAESAPESVVLDVDVIRDEVLGNLIANALRFTPPGGRITVEVTGGDGGIGIIVTDSGPGIPDEHRPFIFDKHYTSDRTRLVGSGLGLAIAKEMAELHGGRIGLEDPAPEGGTSFRVTLPLAPATPDLELPPCTPSAPAEAGGLGMAGAPDLAPATPS